MYLHHSPSLQLQNCSNYTIPVPTPLTLPTVAEFYQLYQSRTYTTRPPYTYKAVPTIPVMYLHLSPSLLLQNCINYTNPLTTTLALPTVTELYQIYQSRTFRIRPPPC